MSKKPKCTTIIVYQEDRVSLDRLEELGFPKDLLEVAEKRTGRFKTAIGWTVPEHFEGEIKPMPAEEAAEIRKNKSVSFGPARNWKFIAKPPEGDRAVWQEIFEQANRYRNDLVTVENNRLKEFADARRELFPRLVELEGQLEVIDAEIEQQQKNIQVLKSRDRTRKPDEELQRLIAELRLKKKPLYEEKKALAKEANQHQELRKRGEAIEELAKAKKRELYAACPIPWGCKQAEAAAVGKFPRYHRHDGTGRIVVNIQNRSLSVPDALTGQDNRVQFHFVRKARHGGFLYKARLQLAEGKHLIVPFYLSRSLPEDGRISSVSVHCWKTATAFHWHLIVTLTRKQWEYRDRGTGDVAVNLGWRSKANGLRVAYYADRLGQEGEILLPWELVKRWDKSESLQSIRATMYNKVRATLARWIKGRAIPEWLAERLETLPHWKSGSQGRLASVVLQWRDNRFEGDKRFLGLDAWRRRDKHLYFFQEHNRTKAIHKRDLLYRQGANALADKYGWLILGEVDHAKLARNKLPEDDPDRVSKLYRMVAANGRLEELLKETFQQLLKVDAVHGTIACNVCGFINNFNRLKLVVRCSACGASWDQDANFCRNMLARAEVLDKAMGVLRAE